MIELKCKSCGRHFGEVEVIVGELLCGNSACRGGSQYKILNSDVAGLITYKFNKPPRPPKKKADASSEPS